MGQVLVTERQLAEMTSQSIRTLQAQRLRGDGIPYVKLGRSVRYDLEEVKAYLAAQRRQSTSNYPGKVAQP